MRHVNNHYVFSLDNVLLFQNSGVGLRMCASTFIYRCMFVWVNELLHRNLFNPHWFWKSILVTLITVMSYMTKSFVDGTVAEIRTYLHGRLSCRVVCLKIRHSFRMICHCIKTKQIVENPMSTLGLNSHRTVSKKFFGLKEQATSLLLNPATLCTNCGWWSYSLTVCLCSRQTLLFLISLLLS